MVNRNKPIAAPAALAVIALLIVAGCGGAKKKSSSSGQTGATSAATTKKSSAPAIDIAALPGAQVTAPPWKAGNGSQLESRLNEIGLPPLTAEGSALHIHQHIDIYVDGKHVKIPANVGIDAKQQFISDLHTHDSTGVIHVESPVVQTFRLGQFFAVWGVPLSASQIGSLKTGGGKILKVWANGKPVTGDPQSIALAPHQEIVVFYGKPGKPAKVPGNYQFAPGL